MQLTNLSVGGNFDVVKMWIARVRSLNQLDCYIILESSMQLMQSRKAYMLIHERTCINFAFNNSRGACDSVCPYDRVATETSADWSVALAHVEEITSERVLGTYS